MTLSPAVLLLALALLLMIPDSAHADKVDDYVRQQARLRHIPGLSIAVVRQGKVIKARGYGLANVELNTPATPDTVYQLASVTKQFTATAILLLVQDGKIRVDDKVSQYVENTPDSWKDITLRHLLTHTSGIKDYLNEVVDSPTSSIKVHDDTTTEKIIQGIVDLPLDFVPGAKFAYSNTNYLLLSMVVRRSSGKPYDVFLAERVFQPLGMTATRLTRPEALIPNRAAGYTWVNKQWQNSPPLNPTLWDNGDGGIVSSVLDLAKWDAALYGNSILTEASKQMMWSPVRFNDGTTGTYGFGWGVTSRKGHRFITHNGGRPGTATVIMRYPDDQLTIIVLANQDHTRCTEIADRIAGFYIPDFAPPIYKPIPDNQPQIKEQARTIVTGFAQGKPLGDFLPPGIPTGVTGFPDPINSSQALADSMRRLGEVRSLELVERKSEGDLLLSRYRVTYPQDHLLMTLSVNKDQKITRIDFQIE